MSDPSPFGGIQEKVIAAVLERLAQMSVADLVGVLDVATDEFYTLLPQRTQDSLRVALRVAHATAVRAERTAEAADIQRVLDRLTKG